MTSYKKAWMGCERKHNRLTTRTCPDNKKVVTSIKMLLHTESWSCSLFFRPLLGAYDKETVQNRNRISPKRARPLNRYPQSLETPIRGFPKIKKSFWGGPYNVDYNILGSMLGPPYLGKLPKKPQEPQPPPSRPRVRAAQAAPAMALGTGLGFRV